MSVAADMNQLCQGLILLNSAGSILTPEVRVVVVVMMMMMMMMVVVVVGRAGESSQ